MLMWNARADDIVAAPVTGYKIESSPLDASGDCAATWTTLVADTMNTMTSYTHRGLSPDTGMCYRVFGINIVATSTSFVGFGDSYVTTNDNDAIATTDEAAPNAAPMPVGTISGITVEVGGTRTSTNAVSTYFSDADAGDMLTYSASSSDDMVATAMITTDDMISITGVAVGMATITVTATDMADATAMQDIMVTVEAVDVTLGNAMTLMATQGDDPGDVTLTWDPGANATVHWIAGFRIVNGAIDPNFSPIWHAAGGDGTHTVNAPAAGEYVFAVIAGRTADDSTEWSRWITQRYTRQ